MARASRPAKPKRSPKPRRSRWARWVLRPLVWSPALLALIVVAVLFVVQSDRFAGALERFAEERAGAYLGREVEIGSLSIEVVPLSVEARDVVIAGPSAGSDGGPGPAFVEVPRLQILARVSSFPRPGVTFERVYVESPVIRVNFDESGQHDAPRTTRRRRPDAPRRFDFEVAALELVGGSLEVNHRKYPLEISARDFVANLAESGNAGEAPLELAGQVRADDVTVVLPRARPYLGAVSARGAYRPGRVEIADARFDAPELAARAQGAVAWREQPGARLEIEASGEGRLLDRLGYGEGLVRGPFEFSGTFERSERDWALEGGLSSPAVTVVDRRLTSVNGRLRVDESGARYEIETAGYGRGALTGTVRMAPGSGEAPVELDLRLARVELARLLADQAIPITGLAATATGSFSYQFPRAEPRSGNGWADLKIDRQPESGSGLGVNGSAVMSFGDGRLRTEAVRLTNERQLIVAAGSYDMVANRGRFQIDVATKAVEEVLALLPVDDPQALWRPSRGQGEVTAVVALDGSAVLVNATFSLGEVAASGYEAERLEGRFTLDERGLEDLRLELLRPDAALIVSGSVPLAEEVVASGSGLELALDAEGWELAEFAPWLPFELPVEGPFSGGATIEGSLQAPRGSVRGRLDGPRFGNFQAARLEVDLEFSPEVVVFHEAQIAFAEGLLRARGTYDPGADRIALEFDSDRLELAGAGILPVASERLGGGLEVTGTLAGSAAKPEVSLRLGVEGLALDGNPIGASGSGAFELDWDGRDLRAGGGIEGLVRLAGGGVVEDADADLTFEIASGDIPSILRLLGAENLTEFEAEGRGRAGIRGRFDPDSMPDLRLTLDELGLRQTGERVARRLENLEPVELVFGQEGLVVESFYLGTPDGTSEIFVAGAVGLEEDGQLDLKVQSALAAAWFEPWVPAGVELAAGSFDVIGSVRGTLGEPRLDGVGRFTRGKVITTGFPATFDSTEAVFLFFPGQVILDQLSAKVAGGRVQGAGRIDLAESAELDYRFQVSGQGLNFRYPEGWSIRGKTELTISSIPGGRQINGALDLDRALYVSDVPIELDQLLRSYFEQRRLEVEETDELLSTTQLNLAVGAEDTLRIRNNLANLRGSADLVIRGSLASPVVFGTVEFDPSGKLIYSGNEYELERGLLTFANPYRLEPVIDLVANTRLREYDVTLSLSGTPERMNFDFVSDPPLAELEVIALMTGGRPQEPLFGETPRSSGLEGDSLGAEAFLAGQATSAVASRFNRLFGLDQFRIVPLTSSTGDLSSARVTVGKQISRDLFATYSYDRSESGEQVFELEWSISRSLVLVVTQNGDGTYAVDAKYEKAF